MRELDVWLQGNIGLALVIVEKAPASGFEQLVDLDAGLCLFGVF